MYSVKATTKQGVTELVRLGSGGVELLDPERDGRKATRFELLRDAEAAVRLLHAKAEAATPGELGTIAGMRLGVAETAGNPGTTPAVLKIARRGDREEDGGAGRFVQLWNGSGPCAVSGPEQATVFGDAASAEGTAGFARAWLPELKTETEELQVMYCKRRPYGRNTG